MIYSLRELKKLAGEFLITQVGRVKVVRHTWSAVLDSRVCELCANLDGLTVEAGDSDYRSYAPPLHSRCRCMWISTTDKDPHPPEIDWKKPPKKLVKEFAPSLLGLPEKEIVIGVVLPVVQPYIGTPVKTKTLKREIFPVTEENE